MSQVYPLPILGSQTLKDTRPLYNSAFDALLTHFIGGADPSSLFDGMIFVNTTTAKIKGRALGITFEIGDWGVAQLGHLRKDGTIPLTADWNVGAFKITNLATPTANGDAATKLYADGKVAKAGDTMTGLLTLSGDPVSALQAATKQYVDGKVTRSGDTMTGVLNVISGAGATAALPRSAIENLITFNTTVGHNHDGTNSRYLTILASIIDNVSVSLSNAGITLETLGGPTQAIMVDPGSGSTTMLGLTVAMERFAFRAVEHTLVSDQVQTRNSPTIIVRTEGGAGSDNLANISSTGAVVGEIIYVKRKIGGGENITVQDSVGNLRLETGSNFVLNDERRSIAFMWDGTFWREIHRAG